MKQGEFEYETPFEKRGGIVPFDTPVATAEENVRLSKQCQAILDRLLLGSATNKDLIQIACNYTARISTLRLAGHIIPPPKNLGGGLTLYHLEEK